MLDYLTEEELMQFVQLYYQRTLPEKLQLTLAFFLFMCFTSMHITDARMFCIEQVNNDVLTYYRVKNRNCKRMSSCLGRYFFVNPKFLGNGLQLSVNDLVTLNVPEQTSLSGRYHNGTAAPPGCAGSA